MFLQIMSFSNLNHISQLQIIFQGSNYKQLITPNLLLITINLPLIKYDGYIEIVEEKHQVFCQEQIKLEIEVAINLSFTLYYHN